MKVVGLEEHVVTAEVLDAWDRVEPRWRDPVLAGYRTGELARRLTGLGPERFAAMAETGLDAQVLSLTAPGVHGARRFLAEADLTDTGRRTIASGNWERLTSAIHR